MVSYNEDCGIARAQQALDQNESAVDSLVRAARLAEEISIEFLRQNALKQLSKISEEHRNWTALINLLDSLIDAHPTDADLVRLREDAQLIKKAEDSTAEE